MKAYDATVEIQAGPDTIWAILTDALGYQAWDSGRGAGRRPHRAGREDHRALPGQPGPRLPGQGDRVRSRPADDLERRHAAGPVQGRRTITLAPGSDGTTRFTVREEYTGPLLPLIWRSMPDLAPSFRQFATGLKQRAER
jgi:hypothetical protein